MECDYLVFWDYGRRKNWQLWGRTRFFVTVQHTQTQTQAGTRTHTHTQAHACMHTWSKSHHQQHAGARSFQQADNNGRRAASLSLALSLSVPKIQSSGKTAEWDTSSRGISVVPEHGRTIWLTHALTMATTEPRFTEGKMQVFTSVDTINLDLESSFLFIFQHILGFKISVVA